METLFDIRRHETLEDQPWSDGFATEEIYSIVEDICVSTDEDNSWPTHPLDAESYPNVGPKWAQYAGAAGVLTALQILDRTGFQVCDLQHRLPAIHGAYLQNPDVTIEPGLQIGEMGIMIPTFLWQPDNEALKKKLLQCMENTLELPFYEITSGQTGMMHAALALYKRTKDDCWKELYLKGADVLLKAWERLSGTEEWHWESHIFGCKRRYYGACHGLAGNANILILGADLLPNDLVETIIERTVSTLALSVIEDNDMANWIHFVQPQTEKRLVQWCHGAAGIITSMAGTPISTTKSSITLDGLLRKSGKLVWKAGPLTKGAGLCHGTAGNGYAFLYLYKRWGDAIWLERAKTFAMHAIKQSRQSKIQYGQRRFSLWTGDAGLAVYLHHCINPHETAFPGLELF